MPELAVHPGDSGDEAVRLDRAQDRAGVGIDLVDLSITIERLAPGGERVARAVGTVTVGTALFLIARATIAAVFSM